MGQIITTFYDLLVLQCRLYIMVLCVRVCVHRHNIWNLLVHFKDNGEVNKCRKLRRKIEITDWIFSSALWAPKKKQHFMLFISIFHFCFFKLLKHNEGFFVVGQHTFRPFSRTVDFFSFWIDNHLKQERVGECGMVVEGKEVFPISHSRILPGLCFHSVYYAHRAPFIFPVSQEDKIMLQKIAHIFCFYCFSIQQIFL